MVETGRLAPEEIIKKKHAEAAFKYIHEHGRLEGDIRYYKTPSPSLDAWVVEFEGEKYFHWQTLKLAQLFALKDTGVIKDEEPPFPIAYREHISGILLKRDEAERVWQNMGFTPRRNVYTADDEHGGLVAEEIIKKRHAELAFKYIREHNQQEDGIRYYKTRPNVENAWVVEFDGEEYYHREALKLSYLFALKEIGEITNEEPPFDAVYKEYVSAHWINFTRIRDIWISMGFDPRDSKNATGSSNEGERIMAEIDRLAPEKIIERKHTEAAFNYIREHGGKKRGIWYYKDRDGPGKIAWVVEFDGEEYWQRETLRLANLFALKDAGVIKGEESPFPAAYKEHVIGRWLRYHEMEKIWKSMGVTPRRNVDAAGGEYSEEHQDISNNIVRNGYNQLRQFRQIIFHGPPGTGKTYNAKEVLVELFKGEFNGELPARGERWNIVQFHPSYNYEDFVRGIKVGTHREQIKYETENRVFGKMCERANNDKSNDYALIIDEINRANVSAVLGELIYALEYRGESIDTPYAIGEGENKSAELIIPENLYIIGTMNTADRTIGQIDYAVRRRFAFVYCGPDEDVITDDRALSFFERVDAVFDAHTSSDFDAADVRIGHSYFLAEGVNLANKILYQVIPVLWEYVKDGILLEGAKSSIKEIEESAQKMSSDLTLNVSVPTSASSKPSKPSKQSKHMFFWEREGRYQVSGIGWTALSIVQDYVRYSQLNNLAELQKWLPDNTKNIKSRGIRQRDDISDDGRFFMNDDESIEIVGETVYLSREWGQGEVFNDFMTGVEKDGYRVHQCNIVNIGKGKIALSNWGFCRKFRFLSTSEVMENENPGAGDWKKLKKDDVVLAFLENSNGKRGAVGLGKITGEAALKSNFKVDGVSLLDCKNDNDTKYQNLRPETFEFTGNEKQDEWCIGIDWIQAVDLEEAAYGKKQIKAKFKTK